MRPGYQEDHMDELRPGDCNKLIRTQTDFREAVLVW